MSLKLYMHYISINIRSVMQYKTSFLFTAIGQFLISFQVFLGIFFMFQRFSNVKGFTYSEVLLCFSIMLLEFSIAEMYARGFDQFSGMVRQGTFDRILVRPQNEILQVLGSKFELTRIGRMLQAIIMFIYGISKSEINWTVSKIFTVFFIYRWSKGIWKISYWHIWEKNVTVYYLCHSLCLSTILSTIILARKKNKYFLCISSTIGNIIFNSLLSALEMGGISLSVKWILISNLS